MVEMHIDVPKLRGHERLYWAASVLLAFLAGAAVTNGMATQKALDDYAWQCHLTLQSDIARLRHTPELQ